MRQDNTQLIILEGISGSGKSTLLRKLNEMRNFEDHHWHRWTATKWVYGTIERRPIFLEQLRSDEEAIQRIYPTTLVTLTCDVQVALERKKEMKNEYIENQIELANKLFIAYHQYLTMIKNKIIVNTDTDTSIDTCALLILDKILKG